MDPEAYTRKINDLELGTLREKKVQCKADAEKVLRQTKDFQRRLNQIKREINLEMKSIRSEYKERRTKAGEGFSGVLTLVGQRKLAGSVRADAKRQMTKERDQVLVQYDKVKLHIDSLLTQLNRLKIQNQSVHAVAFQFILQTISVQVVDKVFSYLDSTISSTEQFLF
jgi:hypothetical protein